mmetsp:Transcript_41977/g.88151  ORF Transcript_41977/g.88151 Transcript_41977/m.88151 type:complete len:83 (-) Transcript_41977:1350-1598(-)
MVRGELPSIFLSQLPSSQYFSDCLVPMGTINSRCGGQEGGAAKSQSALTVRLDNMTSITDYSGQNCHAVGQLLLVETPHSLP